MRRRLAVFPSTEIFTRRKCFQIGSLDSVTCSDTECAHVTKRPFATRIPFELNSSTCTLADSVEGWITFSTKDIGIMTSHGYDHVTFGRQLCMDIFRNGVFYGFRNGDMEIHRPPLYLWQQLQCDDLSRWEERLLSECRS